MSAVYEQRPKAAVDEAIKLKSTLAFIMDFQKTQIFGGPWLPKKKATFPCSKAALSPNMTTTSAAVLPKLCAAVTWKWTVWWISNGCLISNVKLCGIAGDGQDQGMR